jgi:ankyrin repeat protein
MLNKSWCLILILGDSALIIASKNGHKDIVIEVLNHGADINLEANLGNTFSLIL